jgi:serine/threonine-protein kinase RsbW
MGNYQERTLSPEVEETVSDDVDASGAIPLGVSRKPTPPDPSDVGPPHDRAFVDDIVELRLPAASAYLSVLRTATAGLAARLDFTLDEIEDLRIAVDEACALLIPDAAEGADLTCLFSLTPDALSVTVQVPSRTGRAPRRNTFAWTVLTALAGEVDAYTDDHQQVAVTLLKRRGGRS